MRSKPRRCALLVILVASSSLVFAQSHTTDVAASTHESVVPTSFRQYIQQNDLDISGTKPWYLKAEFHRFDIKGKEAEAGTFEQWWLTPTSWRIDVHLKDRDLTFVHDHGKTYSKSKDDLLPIAVEWLQPLFVEPVPEPFFVHSASDITKRPAGSITLDCANLTQNGLGTFAHSYFPHEISLCFGPQNDLRIVSVENGAISFARNRMGTFLGHSVAVQVDGSDRSGKLFSGQIAALKTITPEAIDLSTDKLVENEIASNFFSDVAPEHPAKALSKPAPQYPLVARQEGLGGIVFVRAVIGLNGHIETSETISAPSRELSDASEEAVKGWSYEPVTLDGHPVKEETIFELRFNINGAP